MAHAYMLDRAVASGLSHLVIESAGLLGIEGQTAASLSVKVHRESGVDLTRHRSRGLRPSDMRTADLVLVMTQAHLEEIHRRFPERTADVYLLRAFEQGPEPRGGAADLDDPVLGPIDAHRAAFAMIRNCVDHLLLSVKHRV